MSKVVDERIVEMKFDNKNFESNVKTSMSTLEKLKSALNLKGASKGLEDVSSAAKKFDMSSMANSVDTVKVKFSALQTVAMTALSNITNSVMQAGKNIASTFTIDPIKDGFTEYETQMNAIQTILANTSSKGTTLDQVNSALDELNHYADKTIYNFTEMTKNIGTFTAAGIDLNTSVSAIQGIANVAAVSGSTSQQAATAMYQLSQALAAGSVKLQDWNSVVNAGMGGEVFQNALKETSELLGTGAEAAIEAEGSFRESLSKGWLTAEVLTETLKKFTKTGAAEYLSNLTGIEQSQIEATQELVESGKGGTDAYAELADQMASTGKITADSAKEILEMADTAENAATKVKTFSQLWDTLKEAAGSGWTTTWETIIGDFEDAKTLWTGVSDTLSGMINNMSDARNAVLKDAMSSGWDKFVDKIGEANISTDELQTSIENLVGEEKLSGLIDEYGSLEDVFRKGALSTDILKQALDGVKSSLADIEVGMSKATKYDLGEGDTAVTQLQQALIDTGQTLENYGVDGRFGSETEAALKAFQEAKGLEVTGVVDEQTLAALEEATSTTGKLTQEMYDLADSVITVGGREYLIQGLSNAWEALLSVIKPIKAAFRDIFPATTGEQIRSMLEKFAEFTSTLKLNYTQAKQLRWAFKGLFSVLDIGVRFVKSGASNAFKLLKKVIGGVDGPILTVASSVGKALYQFRNWIVQNELIEKSIGALGNILSAGIDKIAEWVSAFTELPVVQEYISKFKDAFISAKNAVVEFVGDGTGPLASFGTTLKTVFADAWTMIKNVATEIWQLDSTQKFVKKIQNGFSTEFSKISESLKDFVENLKNIKNLKLTDIITFFMNLKDKIADFFGSFGDKFSDFTSPFDDIRDSISDFAESVGEKLTIAKNAVVDFINGNGIVAKLIRLIGLFRTLRNIRKFTKYITEFLDPLKDVFKNFAGLLDQAKESLEKFVNAKAFSMKMNAFTSGLLNVAKSIALIAASLYIIAQLDDDELERSAKVIAAIAGVIVAMGALSVVAAKMGGTIDMAATGIAIKSIAKSLLYFAVAAKLLGGMDTGELIQGGVAIVVFLGVMSSIMKSAGNMGAGATAAASVGKMMKQFAASILIMVVAMKLIAGMDAGDLIKSGVVLIAMFAVIKSMMAATQSLGTYSKNSDKVGKMMERFAVSLLVMTASMKILSGISTMGLIKGLAAIAVMSLIFESMMEVSQKATIGKDAKSNMAGMVAAIAVMAAALYVLSDIPTTDLAKAAGAMASVMGTFALMMKYGGSMSTGGYGKIIAMIAIVAAIAAGLWALTKYTDNTDDMLKIATSISEVLVAMSAAALMLSKIGAVSGVAVGGAAKMIALVAAISAILIVIGGLAETFASAGLEAAIVGLQKIGSALGNFIGGFISGIGEGMTSALPEIGKNLAEFSEAISGIDSDSAKAAENLANMFFALEGASIVDGIASFLGVGDLSEFASKAETFATTMVEISNAITANGGINSDAIKQVTKAGKLFTALNEKIPKSGGILQALIGEQDLERFGESCKAFVKSMKAISSSLNGFTIDESKIEEVTKAGIIFNELNKAIPKEGFFTKLLGQTTLESFGESCTAFIGAMKQASDAITADGGSIDADAIESAVDAGKAINKLAKTVPDEKNTLFTQSSFGTFASNVSDFGDAMAEFSGKVKNLNTENITGAVTAAQGISDLANTLTGTDTTKLDEFVTKDTLSKFGTIFSDFNRQLGSDFNAANIQSAINAAVKLTVLGNTLSRVDFGDADFAGSIEPIADAVVDFSEKLSSTDGSGALASVNKIAAAVSKANSTDTSNISSFVTAVQQLGGMSVDTDSLESTATNVTSSVSTMMSSVSSSVSNSRGNITSSMSKAMSGAAGAIKKASSSTTAAATALAKAVASAIAAQAGAVTSAASSMVSGGSSAIRAYYWNFYSAGSYLGAGLAQGLNAQVESVRAAATRLSLASQVTITKLNGINSPAKVWIGYGKYMGEGLAIGLKSMVGAVSAEGTALSEAVNDSVSSTMSTFGDLFNTDLNTIKPTIAPVMDLSDVSSGMDDIAAMFNNNPSLTTLENARAISAAVSARNQNGTNADVVSAINALGKLLGGTSGDTYNINGVTYDDGSNIAAAVAAIVQAARISRRA